MTPDIERNMLQRIEQLKEQNRDLLEALKIAVKVIDRGNAGALSVIEKAIAKAEAP